jgi:hypothetical protein
MSPLIKYVLDTNVFIEASKRYYAFDIAPPFWKGLVTFAQQREIISIDKVYDEIIRGKDDLANWAKTVFHMYFDKSNTPGILEKYSETIKWGESQNQYNQLAKDEFYTAKNADAWVIAYAHANNCTIVTHEKFDPNIKKRIPIPNVCKVLKIPCINTFEMLRSLEFIF